MRQGIYARKITKEYFWCRCPSSIVLFPRVRCVGAGKVILVLHVTVTGRGEERKAKVWKEEYKRKGEKKIKLLCS